MECELRFVDLSPKQQNDATTVGVDCDMFT